jgi:hypothetical protein
VPRGRLPARSERPGSVHDLTPVKRTAALVALMVFLAATRAGGASDRLAVLIVVEGDAELSDNLTEVAISKLAQRGDRLLVGLREVRESLGDIVGESGIGGCVEQPACLARLGAATRAESALIGDVRRETGQFAVRLSLVNTRTGAREAEFAVTVPADMKRLIAAIRTGVVSLFEPKVAPPVVASATEPSHPATEQPLPPPLLPGLRDSTASPPSLVRPREEAPARGRWLTAAGYGAGGAAIVALSAAVVIGKGATGMPTGATRSETLRDLERREHDATLANSLFVVGGGLAIAACAAFFWRWRHD